MCCLSRSSSCFRSARSFSSSSRSLAVIWSSSSRLRSSDSRSSLSRAASSSSRSARRCSRLSTRCSRTRSSACMSASRSARRCSRSASRRERAASSLAEGNVLAELAETRLRAWLAPTSPSQASRFPFTGKSSVSCGRMPARLGSEYFLSRLGSEYFLSRVSECLSVGLPFSTTVQTAGTASRGLLAFFGESSPAIATAPAVAEAEVSPGCAARTLAMAPEPGVPMARLLPGERTECAGLVGEGFDGACRCAELRSAASA
mmetsp:Transcript_66210/g.144338  ORF Transcript_66210/g.144338 Transcript_66210/m.144338 type:complete len:260 (+) Transcript_66210:259-1038(+)